MKLRTLLLIIMLVFTVTACDTDSDEEADVPAAEVKEEGELDVDAREAEELPPPQVPDDDSDIESTIEVSGDPTQGSFDIEVTGDIEATFEGGTAVYTDAETIESQQIPEYHQLVFRSEDGLYQAILQLPADAVTGIHDISGSSFQLEGADENFTAMFTDFENLENETHDESIAYGSDVEGTITIDKIGDTISGSFEFTAYAISPDEPLTDSVTVTGTFMNLELL